MTPADLTEAYCRLTQDPAWQQRLRRSVRLRLALGEPGVSPCPVRAALRLLEDELCQQLLGSTPALAGSPEAASTASLVLQLEQLALLSHRADCEALRREWPTQEFLPALGRTCHPPRGSWLLRAA